MKKIIVLAAVCVALCGCESEPSLTQWGQGEVSPSGQESDGRQKVTFVVGSPVVESEGMTRASLTEGGVSDLWVFEGNTLLKHQVSTDEDFGSPTVELELGEHSVTFIASKSDGQTWTSGEWICTKVKDTFGTVLSYTVTNGAGSKSVELKRLVGKVLWTIEDAIPAMATDLEIGVTQCYGLDYRLEGTHCTTYESTIGVSSYRGVKGTSVAVFVLPASQTVGMETSASIAVKSGSGQICSYSHTFTVMPNQQYKIHGSYFGGQKTMSVSVDDTWGAENDIDV